MYNELIQWNIRGVKANLNELILLTRICLAVIDLQETFFKKNNDINIKHYFTTEILKEHQVEN